MLQNEKADDIDGFLSRIQHRFKNMAAVIRSIAGRTGAHSADIIEFQSRFDGRLGALVRANAIMARTTDQGVDLSELIGDSLIENAPAARNWRANGPPVHLTAPLVEMAALVIHELAVESSVSGSLGRDETDLEVQWRLTENGSVLHFEWVEPGRGGRPLSEGFAFARELLEQALPYQFGAAARVQVSGAGLVISLEIPLGAVS